MKWRCIIGLRRKTQPASKEKNQRSFWIDVHTYGYFGLEMFIDSLKKLETSSIFAVQLHYWTPRFKISTKFDGIRLVRIQKSPIFNLNFKIFKNSKKLWNKYVKKTRVNSKKSGEKSFLKSRPFGIFKFKFVQMGINFWFFLNSQDIRNKYDKKLEWIWRSLVKRLFKISNICIVKV
jgi:hypothetical protein